MNELQWLLDEFEVSHLMIYDPVEDRRLWKGESVDTGLRTLSIDERFVVWKVLNKSVAQALGVLPGDEVLSVAGAKPHSNWQLQTVAGDYLLQRGDKKIHVALDPKPLVIDRSPELRGLSEGVGLLEISSFRAEYFGEKPWQEVLAGLNQFKKVVVDLRDNSGGNLVAMLRGLSPFICTEEKVGLLSQPRRSQPIGPAPPDNLDEMAQIAFLEKYQEVPLKTFPTYGCFRGPVVVLVDGATASVSEIFAHAMMSRPLTRVLGRPTAGDVVLATWYNLPLLGPGYSLSIPEALYLTVNGESLEGGGVWPHAELNYVLAELLAGKDSWLLRARE